MKFILPQDRDKFNFYVDKLKDYDGPVELKKIRKPRTLKQNAYLHAIISQFGIETGYTLDESKTLLKRECSFMRYFKGESTFLRKSSSLDTKELTTWIDWVRDYAGKKGIYLSSPDDYMRNWAEIEQNIEMNKQYM